MGFHLFIGNALCAVDAAGALILPAFVRGTLSRRSDAGMIFAGTHEKDACLIAYDLGFVRSLAIDFTRRRIAEEAAAPLAHHARARRTFGLVEELLLDAGGSIRLPAILQRRARIDRIALIVGTGDAFEIWNPDLALESGDSGLRDLAAFHLEIQQAA